MKNLKIFILGIIIGGVVFGGVGIYASSLLKADEVSFNSSDTEWDVENVKLALDDLYLNSYIATGNTIVAGNWNGIKSAGYVNLITSSTPLNNKYLVYDNENFKVKKAGKYLVNGFLHQLNGLNNSPTCIVYTNGVKLFSTSTINSYPSAEVELNEGDIIEIKCKNNGKDWNIAAWNINYVN